MLLTPSLYGKVISMDCFIFIFLNSCQSNINCILSWRLHMWVMWPGNCVLLVNICIYHTLKVQVCSISWWAIEILFNIKFISKCHKSKTRLVFIGAVSPSAQQNSSGLIIIHLTYEDYLSLSNNENHHKAFTRFRVSANSQLRGAYNYTVPVTLGFVHIVKDK